MESYNDWLAHFGIEGMKWGQRNGPPYPLTARQMNRKERRENKVRAKEYTKELNKKARIYASKADEANSIANKLMVKELKFRTTQPESNKITFADGRSTYLVKREDEENFQKEIAPLKEQYDKAVKEVEFGRDEVSRLLKEIGDTDMRIYLDVYAHDILTGRDAYVSYEKSDVLRFSDEGKPMPAWAQQSFIKYDARYKGKPPEKNRGD